MKKMIITISDINGTRQYTIEQLIRRFVPWIFVSIIIVIAIVFATYKFLSFNTNYQSQVNIEKISPCDGKYVIDDKRY